MSSTKVVLALVTVLAAVGLDFGLSNFLSHVLLDLPNGRKQEYEGPQDGSTLFRPRLTSYALT